MISTHKIATVSTLIVLTQLIACDSTYPHRAPETNRFEPKAVTTLAALRNLDIRFTIAVNSLTVLTGIKPQQNETELLINPESFIEGTNTVTVQFYAEDKNGQVYQLASAEQQFTINQSSNQLNLNGLYYQYTDSDNDGRFDVHELSVQPTDVDNDGTRNVFDTDSDNDGVADGPDSSPYGTLTVSFDQTPSFLLENQLGNTSPHYISRFNGPTIETLHLLNTLPAVSLSTPTLWPSGSWPSLYTERGLEAFELGAGVNNLCPQYRISIDTSSIRSTVSQPVLLYFRKLDNTPFVAPLAATEVANLQNIDSTEQVAMSHWDDALRIIMVPEGTVGWIELWSEPNFTGDLCRINLTTDQSQFSATLRSN
jgi:hypothetical protein